jgi:hypothetical protein
MAFVDVRPTPTETPESPWKATRDLLDGLGLNPFRQKPEDEDEQERRIREQDERMRQNERDLRDNPPVPRGVGN